MANPQTENGHTRIANELLEALVRQPLSGQVLRAFLLLVRKIYGFNKKDDYVSLTQIARGTGLTKVRASQIVKELERRRLITVTENLNGRTKKYRINKDYEQWVTVTQKRNGIRKLKEPLQKSDTPPLQFSDTTKETNKKETNKRKSASADAMRLASLLADRILLNNPKHRFLQHRNKDKTTEAWASDIEKLLTRDGQSAQDIERVIEWCQCDPFWKANILSGKQLRAKWDKLLISTNTSHQQQSDRNTSKPRDAAGREMQYI